MSVTAIAREQETTETATFRCGCINDRPVKDALECSVCSDLVCELECVPMLRCEESLRRDSLPQAR